MNAQSNNAAQQESPDGADCVHAVQPPAERQPPHAATEQAARSVMHPDHGDPDWRYYQTAWHS